jgi:O-antigen/teichoic acid export membrane protein
MRTSSAPAPKDAMSGSPTGGRYQIRRTAVATVAARAAALGTSLIVVRLILHTVGTERFGLWTAINASIALLSFADLGIGNSLLTALSRSRARDDTQGAAKLISSATYAFAAIAVVLAAALVVLFFTVNWAAVFRVNGTAAARDADSTFLVVGLSLVAALPLTIVAKLQLAYQQGYRTQLWTIVGQAGALLSLVIAVRANASLPVLAVCVLFVPLVAQLANAALSFAREHAAFLPRRALVDSATTRALLATGLLFLFLQLSWTVAFASDNLIIDRILGANAVAGYAIPYQGFSAVATLAALPLTALWPAYTDAATRRDLDWLRRRVRRTIGGMAILGVTVGGVALLVARPLLGLWVGHDTHYSTALLWGFALWIPVFCIGNAVAVYLNAMGVVRFQVATVSVMVVANLALSIALVRAWGPAGAIYGSLISYTVFVALPCAWYLPRHLQRLGDTPDHVLAAAASQASNSPAP